MNDAPNVASDVDVRGFRYALEPVRQREQWRMDQLLSGLARAQKELTQIEAHLDETQHQHDREAEAAARALRQRLDPVAHRGVLGYLAHLRDRCRALSAQRDELASARDRVRSECAAQQLQLESLSLHKADALTVYAGEVRQRHNAEQDRDWLARSLGRRATTRAI